MARPPIAIAHDYLTQRGGAERVVLALAAAYPDAEIHTSLYDADGTFPELRDATIRTMPIDRIAALRADHRRALPVLAPSFAATTVDADVVLCSSSGWAHGIATTGKKLVYCHAPARWLHQRDAYLADAGRAARVAVGALSPALRRWDARAAASADAYLVNSTHTRQMVRDAYDIDATVVHPPAGLDLTTPPTGVPGVEPGFLLVVSRLLPYKNVDAIIGSIDQLDGRRLVVVGSGPDRARLHALAGPNVTFLEEVDDGELAWLYTSADALVAASYEDYGLTPVEAAAAGIPTVALRFGGFLDTVDEGVTGLLFDEPTPEAVADALRSLPSTTWDRARIVEHARRFAEPTFHEAIHAAVTKVAATA